MAINIDDVYQKVLAIANKEQRGYITPQEFNIFASLAQKEILQQYFYDLNVLARTPVANKEHSDPVEIIEEKISPFLAQANLVYDPATVSFSLPQDLYKIGSLTTIGGTLIEEVSAKELTVMKSSPLLNPSSLTPVYYFVNSLLKVEPTTVNAICNYVREPHRPQWGFVVINDQAMYDPNPDKTTHFDLHKSEEAELTYRILALAGIAMQNNNLAQIALGMNKSVEQSEKQ
jgi:hypothetical protein